MLYISVVKYLFLKRLEGFNNYMEEQADIYYTIFSNLRKIIKTADIYSTRLKEKYNINSSQLSCLLVLSGEQSMSLSSLSKKVSLSPSMITNIIDQLEKKELLIRKRSSTDRRVILIELTENGRKVIKNAPLSFQNQLTAGLNQLPQEELEQINTSLTKLLALIVSEVLIDSSILSNENTLVGVDSDVIESEINIKSKNVESSSNGDSI